VDAVPCRLWAEVFEVREEAGDVYWARISDDVVPVNITCIQDMPETIFHITAYNRHVEKIFDVRLIQPGMTLDFPPASRNILTVYCAHTDAIQWMLCAGTRVIPASECFVHWQDSLDYRHWGLNFLTATDAQRFRDCCMVRVATVTECPVML
jgi:hypothetical protein